jgi:hypothetical protein
MEAGGCSIRDEIDKRGIRRVCHSTHPENLLSIAEHGLVSQQRLRSEGIPAIVNDERRLDGRPDFISCSIQVPNAHYMRRVLSKGDWVVLLLDPAPLTRASTLFSHTNAAKNDGANIRPGAEAFRELFECPGVYTRRPAHAVNCPTDLQTEALVEAHVETALLREVVVPSKDVAHTHWVTLTKFARRTGVAIRLSAEMFDPDMLVELVRSGTVPHPKPIEW